MRQSIWKDYFAFSKKERIAVWTLLIIIVVFIVLPYFLQPSFQKPIIESLQTQSSGLQKADSLTDNNELRTSASDTTIEKKEQSLHLFYFDPNTLDETGWKKIGLNDRTIHTIINYRNKGGHFKQPEDIRKIYGLKKEEADALLPYIQITSQNTEETQKQTIIEQQNKPQSTTPNKKIDINTATAEDFKALPGIGDVLSNRIIKFRNAIHGFKSVEDIRKTYGLPDSTYQLILPYLTINDSTVQKN